MTVRKRKDPRRELTRVALIEAAEELFAERGIENVSLRQIGEAIGSDNNAVVTYYFGTKAGLLRGIYEHRVPALESRRSELLEIADENGRGQDTLTLLHAMWAPIFEQRNAKGKASYAGFLASIEHAPLISMIELSRQYPSTREIADRMCSSIGHITESLFWERLRLISMMMVAAIQDAVKLEREGGKRDRVEAIVADALHLSAASLLAPVGTSESLRRLSSNERCLPAGVAKLPRKTVRPRSASRN